VEPGVREYLLRIVNTLSVALLWMAINSTAGIMFGYAFVEDHIRMGNVLFYSWFLFSLAFLLRWVIRLWRKPIDFEQE
jgi:ABC-type glycerol-3-phosphate transport system permease component